MKSFGNTMSDETKRMLFEAFIKSEYPPLMKKSLAGITEYIKSNRSDFHDVPEETIFASMITAINYLYIANLESTYYEKDQTTDNIIHECNERLGRILAMDYATASSDENIHALVLAHLRAAETHLINLLVNKGEGEEEDNA